MAYAAGDMALAYYRRADDALAAQQDTARNRMTELERYLDSLPDLDAKRERLRWLFQNFDAILEQAEPAMISNALADAGFRVMCEEGNCWAEWD